MDTPLVRMSRKSEEFAVQENRVGGDVRVLTGDVVVQMGGTIAEGVTFEIPADVTEVRLGGFENGWYLMDANHQRGWKAGAQYPDNEFD